MTTPKTPAPVTPNHRLEDEGEQLKKTPPPTPTPDHLSETEAPGLTEEQVLSKCPPKFRTVARELAGAGFSWSLILSLVMIVLPKILELLNAEELVMKGKGGRRKCPTLDAELAGELKAEVADLECNIVCGLVKAHNLKHLLGLLEEEAAPAP